MWRLLQQSLEGTSHRRSATPCQDNCAGTATCPGQESFLVVACSDGAGSAALSQVGSALACRRFIELACEALEREGPGAVSDPEVVRGWYRQVRQALEEEASRREVPMRELSCTLLTAVVGEHASVFAQVGDGAIVVRQGEEYVPVFWPQVGEYANTTWFVTSPDLEQVLQVTSGEPVDEVALFTDGLQMLALHFASRSVHRPFFEPLFAALRGAAHPEDLVVPLRAFLDSPAVNERTDDDKTLVLAIREGRAPTGGEP
ncbi:PP2C family serine/threonine-protein phosphatase [Vitiosangium sp. GDMCC 1.1324]|uniref:PP2C family serine/threonine-protein phosphatase n=1 Tax=Vitiosangium sp. (strain GDMCC 1.1324) TaxID=2138576 RepID=UPI000D3D54D1|nr:PP2C family serine/threonine-protein phosphatase [Vitiosangium sp. GDMCC 1.1324]PTL85175.1 protein phosphatase 2C domain-containing protein [Vitiosangium sp. GDMCC 1.1324]